MLRRLHGWLAGLAAAEGGAAAVEFALVAPIMIAFYFGMCEFAQANMADRKTIRTASSIGDLVAQQVQITPTNLTDIMAMTATLMDPFPQGDLIKICVASVVADSHGAIKVAWSKSQNDDTCPAKTASWTPPANLIGANQSLIMSRVSYTYKSPARYFLPNDLVFTRTYYLRPRKATEVACASC